MSWKHDENVIMSLIREVEARPYIFDRRHKYFSHESIKENCWKYILSALQEKYGQLCQNVRIDDIKDKWESLHDNYFKEQQANPGKSKMAVFPPQPFQEALKFLEPGQEHYRHHPQLRRTRRSRNPTKRYFLDRDQTKSRERSTSSQRRAHHYRISRSMSPEY